MVRPAHYKISSGTVHTMPADLGKTLISDRAALKKWEGEMHLDDGIEEVVWINSKNAHEYELSSIALGNILPLLLEKGLID